MIPLEPRAEIVFLDKLTLSDIQTSNALLTILNLNLMTAKQTYCFQYNHLHIGHNYSNVFSNRVTFMLSLPNQLDHQI